MIYKNHVSVRRISEPRKTAGVHFVDIEVKKEGIDILSTMGISAFDLNLFLEKYRWVRINDIRPKLVELIESYVREEIEAGKIE